VHDLERVHIGDTETVTMVEPIDDVSRLEESLHCTWPHMRSAKMRAQCKRAELQEALVGLDSEDTSIVVSGSLARDEFTEGSDIDWTLLIDGLADPKHHDLFRNIRTIVNSDAAKKPGVEGTFGAMVFSHDLIHQIGGEDDTNQNTTRRLLLCLNRVSWVGEMPTSVLQGMF
jgi:predicted nucleotidyltransferase